MRLDVTIENGTKNKKKVKLLSLGCRLPYPTARTRRLPINKNLRIDVPRRGDQGMIETGRQAFGIERPRKRSPDPTNPNQCITRARDAERVTRTIQWTQPWKRHQRLSSSKSWGSQKAANSTFAWGTLEAVKPPGGRGAWGHPTMEALPRIGDSFYSGTQRRVQ